VNALCSARRLKKKRQKVASTGPQRTNLKISSERTADYHKTSSGFKIIKIQTGSSRSRRGRGGEGKPALAANRVGSGGGPYPRESRARAVLSGRGWRRRLRRPRLSPARAQARVLYHLSASWASKKKKSEEKNLGMQGEALLSGKGRVWLQGKSTLSAADGENCTLSEGVGGAKKSQEWAGSSEREKGRKSGATE